MSQQTEDTSENTQACVPDLDGVGCYKFHYSRPECSCDTKTVSTEDAKETKQPSAALLTSPLPPSTPDEFERFLGEQRVLFGHAFKDPEQFEYFAMLPLSNTQKQALIASLTQEKSNVPSDGTPGQKRKQIKD